MRSIPNISTAAAVAALAIIMVSCGGSDSNDSSTSTVTSENPTRPTADAPAADESTADAPAADETAVGTDGASVIILQSRFGPIEVDIAAGSTVSFLNQDAFAHTVTARPDQGVEFNSGELGQDETFEVTFDETGTFAYFCEIHPTMRATVVVG